MSLWSNFYTNDPVTMAGETWTCEISNEIENTLECSDSLVSKYGIILVYFKMTAAKCWLFCPVFNSLKKRHQVPSSFVNIAPVWDSLWLGLRKQNDSDNADHSFKGIFLRFSTLKTPKFYQISFVYYMPCSESFTAKTSKLSDVCLLRAFWGLY